MTRDPATPSRSQTPLVIAFVLLVAGPIIIAESHPWNIPFAFSGFFALELAFAIFSWRTFRTLRPRGLSFPLGIVFAVLAVAGFTMSVLVPLGMAYNRP